MVKRGFRLSKAAEVKRVRRTGRSYAHPFLALVSQPNEGLGVRVAVVAGRSVGGAVQRNRAKRVMRAAMQPLLESVRSDHDLVLLARPAIGQAKSTQVQEAISTLLRRSALLK